MAAFCVDMTCMRITCTSKDQYGSPKGDYWQCQYVFGLEVDHTGNEVLGDNKCIETGFLVLLDTATHSEHGEES